jgi:peptide/nickel transport system permease protein
MVFGLRSSVETGLLAVGLGAAFGTLVGLLAGYRGGWVDDVIMRVVDVQLAIPSIMLLLLVVSVLQPSFITVVFVLALLAWVVYVRVGRAEVLALKEQDMVVGLVAMGASPARVVFRHILANIAGPLIVVTTIEFAHVVIAGAALSYLGLGIPPPDPTLGGMISDGQDGLTAGLWWPVVMPGALLTILVLSVSGLGEGLRGRFDPRARVRASRPGARGRRAAGQSKIG